MTFTPREIKNWRKYEKVRQSGKWNMFDPQARRATGLNGLEYSFVMEHYSELKGEAEKQ